MDSTTKRGNEFRDLVASFLQAAGFDVATETLECFKKADARAVWMRDELSGPSKYIIEAKANTSTFSLTDCDKFVFEYGRAVDSGEADSAWLVCKGPISPHGRASIEKHRRLRCFTFSEFQRTILNVDPYLRDLISKYEDEGIGQFYINPETEEGQALSALIRDWLDEKDRPLPRAVVSGYGKGKSTFAKHLAADMAQDALSDSTKRVPLLIPLGEVLDEITVDSLVARLLTSRHRAFNYHYHLFDALNQAGRFLIILDGFDEMKHGMTPGTFERVFTELMRFDVGASRVLILGRDTAFHNDREFQSIIMGRQLTTSGQEVAVRNRRPCFPISIREFNLEESRYYVKNYFPLCLERRGGIAADATREWTENRIVEISGEQFSELIIRPVHAQMLCEIATQPETSLKNLSKFGLYDAFIHYLVEREVGKPGRDPSFPSAIRRKFNASVAWWLWEQGGAQTATLESLPESLCADVVRDVSHEYDAIGLKRELASGLLAEKGARAIYFPHRSTQEFLVAEHLSNLKFHAGARHGPQLESVLPLLNPEIVVFLLGWFGSKSGDVSVAYNWLAALEHTRCRLHLRDTAVLIALLGLINDGKDAIGSPVWAYWLGFLSRRGRASFHLRHDDIASVSGYLSRGFTQESLAGAALGLTGSILADNQANRDELLPHLVAAWLPRRALTQAIAEASRGKSVVSHVRREENFLLWAFLRAQAVPSTRDALYLSIDITRIFELAAEANSGGIIPESEAQVRSSGARAACPVQALYRALTNLGVPEHEIDGIRPFFTDPGLRARIRPLVVERREAGRRARSVPDS